MKQTEVKREIEFRLVDDEHMPPIVITIGENDLPKVVINRHYTIWLSLHRKCIGGCAKAMFDKIDKILTAHLREARVFERLE